jgi:hypothetical protein
MVAESRDGIGLSVVSVPAVFSPVTVVHFTAVIRICRAFQEFLCQVNRIVQVIVVHISAIDVNLAQELRSKSLPIPFQDVAEIIIFPPVLSHLVVDLPSQFIPDRFGVTILPHRRINGLPDIPLVSGTAFCRDSQLLVVCFFEGAADLSQPISLARPGSFYLHRC